MRGGGIRRGRAYTEMGGSGGEEGQDEERLTRVRGGEGGKLEGEKGKGERHCIAGVGEGRGRGDIRRGKVHRGEGGDQPRRGQAYAASGEGWSGRGGSKSSISRGWVLERGKRGD